MQNKIHCAELSSFKIAGDQRVCGYREVCFECNSIIISTTGTVLHHVCKNLWGEGVCGIKKYNHDCPERQIVGGG